jgi:hypothetical protein
MCFNIPLPQTGPEDEMFAVVFVVCVVICIITLYRHLSSDWDAFVNLFTDEQDSISLNLYSLCPAVGI